MHGERLFTPAEVARLHAALQQAAARHITVVASSGDTGVISDDGPPVQVSLPASDPLVLAAGGTALNASIPPAPTTARWPGTPTPSASAGGYNSLFRRPSYQDAVPRIGRMRGVPDVAADADSSTAMALLFSGGVLYPAQGTSAATPLWRPVARPPAPRGTGRDRRPGSAGMAQRPAFLARTSGKASGTKATMAQMSPTKAPRPQPTEILIKVAPVPGFSRNAMSTRTRLTPVSTSRS